MRLKQKFLHTPFVPPSYSLEKCRRSVELLLLFGRRLKSSADTGPWFNKLIVRGELAVTLDVSLEPDTKKGKTIIQLLVGLPNTPYSTFCATLRTLLYRGHSVVQWRDKYRRFRISISDRTLHTAITSSGDYRIQNRNGGVSCKFQCCLQCVIWNCH